MRGMHPPASHFQNVFDVCNFFVISNHFDSNKPSALARIIENERTKCIVCGEALRIKVENCSQSTKIAITACKF